MGRQLQRDTNMFGLDGPLSVWLPRGLNEWELFSNWITSDEPRARYHSVKAAKTECGDSNRTPSCSLVIILKVFTLQENKKPGL